jgi:hypothetical protein
VDHLITCSVVVIGHYRGCQAQIRRSEGMGFLVHSGRTTKPPAAPDDRSPLRPHRRRSIRRHQRPATVRNGVQMSQSCGPNRMATSGSATANGCTRLGRRLELVTHQCARCAYATFTFTFDFTDFSRSQNFNCSQPLKRPANRPQDQIPERAGPRGWRTGVTAWSPQPRSSP